MKRLTVCAAVAAAACAACAQAERSVALVENGVAKCRVVLADDASLPEKFGARELAKYFAKATGCGELDGQYEIAIDCRDRRDGLDPWKEDEFEIDVGEKRMTITGYGKRGALYGVYEVLKEYAGMRWLVPGEDGEYCVHKGGTIELPLGKTSKKPYLKIRETRTSEDEGFLWTVRNNMQSQGLGLNRFQDAKGRRPKGADRLEELCEKGIGPCGHIQSVLLLSDIDKPSYLVTKEMAEKTFKEHPDWFPVEDGKRKLIWGPADRNPCVTNSGYLDHAAAVICSWIDRPHGRDSYMTIGNNDIPMWCECEKCRALDAPERKGTRGEMSDRNWYMVGEIAKRVWKRFPEAKLAGWAYQNFWYPPVNVKIDPRLKVFISFNHQCWRHSCLDPKCKINAEMRRIYGMWAKTGLPLVVNRDEVAAGGAPGSDFLPSESIAYQNFLDYAKMGCSGSHFCISGPYPRFLAYRKESAPFYGHNDGWYAMWQMCYLSSRFEWDITRDYAKEYEEANSLYYGHKAWDGAMKEFRRTLEKAFFETPGCIGWGSGAPLGRCLDQAGMEAKLKGLLDKAVAIAKEDGDQKALKHIEMEKSVFERTWLVARKSYLENFKELNVYRRAGEIKVDGVLDEADWKNADVLSNFAAAPWGKVKTDAIQQTFVRVVYDPDWLYIAVEAMEPELAKAKAGKSVDRKDGYGQLGNHVELFYSFPDMAERCFQLMFNSEGQIVDNKVNSIADVDTSFTTSAKWAVKKGADRWTLEVAVPCSEIGQNCFDGATWRLNVARQREVEGSPRESSSACAGQFYAPATFINMKFTPKRAAGIGQGRDTAPWQNAGFEAFKPNPTDKRFTWTRWETPDVPKAWDAKSTPGALKEENGNHYIHILADPKTDVSQYFLGPGKGSLHTTFRARGKGRLCLWTGNYTDYDPPGHGYRIIDGTSKNNFFDLTPEWKTYSFDTPKLGRPTERVAHRFRMRGEGCWADIDDVFVTPHFEQ